MRSPRILVLATVLVAVLGAAGSAQQIIYVNDKVAAPGNGSNWAQAFQTIPAALAVANSGDEVWVAVGFHSAGFTIPAGVTLRGQFLGDQTNGPNGYHSLLQRTFRNRTILNGGGTQRVVTMSVGSVLDGFDLQFGQATAPGGGGALIDGVDCTIRNCHFKFNNDSVGRGAGLLVRGGANPRIETCAFYINGDASSGAAIEVDSATGTYVNLTIDFNENSGLRCTNGAQPTIVNCAFTNNGVSSNVAGYGIEQADTTVDPAVRNNLFENNNTGLYLRGASAMTTIGQLNALGYATANITGNPGYNGLRDYRLTPGSALIDAGDPTTSPLLPHGLYDQPRHLDGDLNGGMRIDIGAAEFTNCELTIPVDIHKHVHLGITGTAGLPATIIVSTAENPVGQLIWPAGELFVGLNPVVVFGYGSIPTLPSQVILYPATGVLAGIPLYWQAATTNGTGFNFSNPAVHVTN